MDSRYTLCKVVKVEVVFSFNFYWSVVDLQCCVSFRWKAKWISYAYTYIHPFFFKVSFPYRPLQNIEPSSLCCTVGSLLVICFIQSNVYIWAFQVALLVKNPPADAGRDPRDLGSIPGSGRSPEGGNGNPLQYSCLENSMDRGAWQATVYEVAMSWTQLNTHIQLCV